jgi:hypothetical protein
VAVTDGVATAVSGWGGGVVHVDGVAVVIEGAVTGPGGVGPGSATLAESTVPPTDMVAPPSTNALSALDSSLVRITSNNSLASTSSRR